MDIQSFAENAAAARQLIQMDRNGSMQRIKNNAIASGKISYDNNGNVIAESKTHSSSMMGSGAQIPKQVSRSGMKLPKEILESMTSNPLEAEISVLDKLDGQMFAEQVNVQPAQNIVTEQTSTSSGFVDYGMIRMICEETIRKYMSSLKKTIVNESKNSNNSNLKALKIGESFSFITEEGDIYEAKLEFKGNINKKTKK